MNSAQSRSSLICGKVLEDYYKENGGIIKVISRSMCGHHPHGLDDPTIIVNFIEEHFEK